MRAGGEGKQKWDGRWKEEREGQRREEREREKDEVAREVGRSKFPLRRPACSR